MYSRCPNCGHQPLPSDQALPAACPECGVILAKVGQSAVTRPTADDEADREGWWSRLTVVPDQVSSTALWLRCLLWVAFGVWGVSLIALDYRDGAMERHFCTVHFSFFMKLGTLFLCHWESGSPFWEEPWANW